MPRAALVLALALGACAPPGDAPPGNAPPGDAPSVTDAYAPAAPAGGTGALFFTVTGGTEPDTLVAVAFAGAARTDVHESYDDDGLRGMRTVPDGVPVAAGATVALAPGGVHAMLANLAAPLVPGDTLAAVATFARAGEQPFRAVVRPLGAMPAP